MHTHARIHTHINSNTHTHTHTHTYIYIYTRTHTNTQLSSRQCCKINRLLRCWGVRPPPNECPRYDTKQSHGEVLVMLELWGMRSTSSLLPGPLFLILEIEQVYISKDTIGIEATPLGDCQCLAFVILVLFVYVYAILTLSHTHTHTHVYIYIYIYMKNQLVSILKKC